MFSVGIDLVEIERIEKMLEKPAFLDKYFGEEEKAQLKEKSFKAESVAAAFAVKEAFLKAMKTGLGGYELREIQTLHEASRAPYIFLSGKAKDDCEKKNLKLSVSITHTKTLAEAIVIAYN